jgi:hypothetical protein
MGISIKWDNPDKTLIILEFNSQWTWDDLYRVTDEMHGMLDTVDHPVDTITILTRSQRLPGGFVGHASRLTSKRHRNSRIGVIVGANKLVKWRWKSPGVLATPPEPGLRPVSRPGLRHHRGEPQPGREQRRAC